MLPLVSFFSVTSVCLMTELLVLMTLAPIMMESMTFVLPLTLKPFRGLEGIFDTVLKVILLLIISTNMVSMVFVSVLFVSVLFLLVSWFAAKITPTTATIKAVCTNNILVVLV